MINKYWLSFCVLLITGNCRAMLASRAEKVTLGEIDDRCWEDQQNINSLLRECRDSLTELYMERRRVECAGNEFIERYAHLLNSYSVMTNTLLLLYKSNFFLEQDILFADIYGETSGDTFHALLSNEQGLAADVTRRIESSLSMAKERLDFMYDVNKAFYEQELM